MFNYTHNCVDGNAPETGVWNQTVKDFGMEIDSAIGPLKLVKRCFVRKGPGVHMVLKGNKGAVNVLIMDGEYVPERIVRGNEFMDWLLLPCPIGSMAIIGHKSESLDQIEQLLERSIHWH